MAEGRILDVSAAGSTIRVGEAGEITDFLDDANPFQFPDVEVSGVGMNFKGQVIRYARGNPFMMSVTVCSGSQNDYDLRKMLKKYHISVADPHVPKEGFNATVVVPKMGGGTNTYTLTNGVMVSGPMGPTATGEGKLQGNTYTMAFATCEQS